jgi:hypothetical protein
MLGSEMVKNESMFVKDQNTSLRYELRQIFLIPSEIVSGGHYWSNTVSRLND